MTTTTATTKAESPVRATLEVMFRSYEDCALDRPSDCGRWHGSPLGIAEAVLAPLVDPARYAGRPDLGERGRLVLCLENAFPAAAREASLTMQAVRNAVRLERPERCWTDVDSFVSYARLLAVLVAWK
ncbi:hypothetical protein [Saccharopolyspora cebuensis]|uniref:hypothetical protein n=1 Tax=Saccharopolyspora cebuensis TaxID=418759 RepID=UPI0031E5CAB5